MRGLTVLLTSGLLVASVVTSSAAAPPTGRVNSFTGDFDIVAGTTTIGHVVATFKEPTPEQLVPGSVDIVWANGNPRSGSAARVSHAQVLQSWFWDDTFPEIGYARMGRVVGVLCDYVGPQRASCDDFAMAFSDIADPAFANQVGFSAPGSTLCCDGPWFDVGRGGFVLNYVGGTAEPQFLERWGTELARGGQPLHEISFNAYNLLELSLAGQAATAREQLQVLGGKGFTLVRVMASPYWSDQFNAAFFDADPSVQMQKRAAYFATFDALLDAADAYGIQIVASLMWNVENLGALGGHSVREGMTNPASLGRQRVDEYIREVVTRYADRPTIAMWEIGNEWNLGADIQWPQFDYTSDELAAAYQDIATTIHSIDSRHLVTTGDSAPRPSAMHLLRAVRDGQPVDWTTDSPEELAGYLQLINPEPIDVISIHYYDDAMVAMGGTLGSPSNLAWFKQQADEMGKPLFVGEIGCTAAVGCLDNGTTSAVPMLRATLPVLDELRLPLTLYWNYEGITDQAVRLIEQANRALE